MRSARPWPSTSTAGVDVIKVMASGGMLTPGSDQLGVQFSTEDLALIVVARPRGRAVSRSPTPTRCAAPGTRSTAGVDALEHFTCLTEEGMVTPPDLLDAIAAAGIVVDLDFRLELRGHRRAATWLPGSAS